ncbi:MAG: CBS domain-containing protein, partial [Rhizomicrobium sp.]
TRSPKIVGPRQLAAEALATMNEKKITVLFVVDPADVQRKPVGIIHMHDCLRAGLQ